MLRNGYRKCSNRDNFMERQRRKRFSYNVHTEFWFMLDDLYRSITSDGHFYGYCKLLGRFSELFVFWFYECSGVIDDQEKLMQAN